MKICVLISCMHERDISIIARSNVQTDVVVVNQCDKDKIEEFNFKNNKGNICHAKFINTTERGLSRSRNMAIDNSWGDICYICDDDEYLHDDFEHNILQAYKEFPKSDVITFAIERDNYNYPKIVKKIGIVEILKTSSVQITFRRLSIVKGIVKFDPQMGSGTGNGGGEENKFLMDCKNKGLKMIYVPNIIAKVKSEESQWFHGFDERFFRNQFWSTRRVLGSVLGFVYIFYWCFYRSRDFDIQLSKTQMLKYSLLGFFEKRE